MRPRFKRRPSAQEPTEVCTPSAEDRIHPRARPWPVASLTVAALLKSMQRLGYLPRLQDVPFAVVAHIRSCLRLPPNTAPDVGARTHYRHHAAISDFLQVRPWDYNKPGTSRSQQSMPQPPFRTIPPT
jgi:hypothetical protein